MLRFIAAESLVTSFERVRASAGATAVAASVCAGSLACRPATANIRRAIAVFNTFRVLDLVCKRREGVRRWRTSKGKPCESDLAMQERAVTRVLLVIPNRR